MTEITKIQKNVCNEYVQTVATKTFVLLECYFVFFFLGRETKRETKRENERETRREEKKIMRKHQK